MTKNSADLWNDFMCDELIAFEEDIAASFNRGEIPYPVHLESGNEDQLIEIFKDVKKNDWVFVSWRGHSKALLKGVSREELKAAIFKGESMALCFPKQRVFGSAIVGGTISIALGVALSIKRNNGSERVWCFLGDMSAHCGIFHESKEYAENFNLPINWVIEDNSISVCTNTKEVWGGDLNLTGVKRFEYHSKFPHCGSGVRVNF